MSPQEFCAALRSAGAAVNSTEALALYRTAAEQGEELIAVFFFWGFGEKMLLDESSWIG